MARSQARIHTSVWRNPDFIKLTASAQATYWMVLSQPDVTMAGVVAYMPERWSQFRADSDIHADLAELEDTGFLVVDVDSREVWIRSFVRNDGVLASRKTRAAMWSAWRGIFSESIRGRFVVELDRLSGTPSHTPPDRASDTPSDTPSDYVAEAIDKGWITPLEASDARRNTPSDTPFPAPGEPLSDGVSPRARADSASSSASSSTSGGHAREPDADHPDDPPPDTNSQPNPTRWDHAWTRIERYVRRYGQHDHDRPPLDLGPIGNQVLAEIGGLSAVRRDDANRFDFRDAWQEAKTHG